MKTIWGMRGTEREKLPHTVTSSPGASSVGCVPWANPHLSLTRKKRLSHLMEESFLLEWRNSASGVSLNLQETNRSSAAHVFRCKSSGAWGGGDHRTHAELKARTGIRFFSDGSLSDLQVSRLKVILQDTEEVTYFITKVASCDPTCDVWGQHEDWVDSTRGGKVGEGESHVSPEGTCMGSKLVCSRDARKTWKAEAEHRTKTKIDSSTPDPTQPMTVPPPPSDSELPLWRHGTSRLWSQ